MSDDLYGRLREFLDKLPPGYPVSPSGVETRILRKLFTEDDVRMELCMISQLEPASVIAGRCGMDEEEAAARLDSMARRGLLERSTRQGVLLYQPGPFIVGIYEGQVASIDREFAEMVEEYLPFLGLSWATLKTEQIRVVPVASAVDTTDAVMTYDGMRDVVRRKGGAVVTDCICRKQQGLLGNVCRYPVEESCMVFDEYAENILDYGWPGTSLSVEEALAKLDRAEELGLVLRSDNIQDPRFICACCSCCDPTLRFMKMLPNPGDLVHSNYIASHDPDECTACATCVDRCPMGAVTVIDDVVGYDPVRCIGCGLCLSTCPAKAFSLRSRETMTVPPLDLEDQQARMLAERGMA